MTLLSSEYIRGIIIKEVKSNPIMTEQKAVYNPVFNRDKIGQFTFNKYGDKKLRSMKLTDHAWDTLESMARERGITRTDFIEEFTRQKEEVDKQAILEEALDKFIEFKKRSYGKNYMQRGKEFNMDARTWDIFREFMKFVEVGKLMKD